MFLFSFSGKNKTIKKFACYNGQSDCVETLFLYTDSVYNYYRGSITYGAVWLDSGKYAVKDSIMILSSLKNSTEKQFGEKGNCGIVITKTLLIKKVDKKVHERDKGIQLGKFISEKPEKGKYIILYPINK